MTPAQYKGISWLLQSLQLACCFEEMSAFIFSSLFWIAWWWLALKLFKTWLPPWTSSSSCLFNSAVQVKEHSSSPSILNALMFWFFAEICRNPLIWLVENWCGMGNLLTRSLPTTSVVKTCWHSASVAHRQNHKNCHQVVKPVVKNRVGNSKFTRVTC